MILPLIIAISVTVLVTTVFWGNLAYRQEMRYRKALASTAEYFTAKLNAEKACSDIWMYGFAALCVLILAYAIYGKE